MRLPAKKVKMGSGERSQPVEEPHNPLYNFHEEVHNHLSNALEEELDGEAGSRFHGDVFIGHCEGDARLREVFDAHIDGLAFCIGDLPALEFIILLEAGLIKFHPDGIARLITAGTGAAIDRDGTRQNRLYRLGG